MGKERHSSALRIEIDGYPVSDGFRNDWKRIYETQNVISPFSNP